MKIHFIKQLLLIGAITISTFSLSHAVENPVIVKASTTKTLEDLDNDRDINKLVSGWMYRDTAQWDKLQNIFTPDATIEVTWFEGRAADFINASKKMGTSQLSAKHLISNPVIEYKGNKAIAETDVMIVVHNDSIKLGSTVHARFYDQIKRVDNEWKISRRQVFYDFGSFNYPTGPVEIDQNIVEKFPIAYAPLGYLLNSAGYPVNRIFATKNSDAEKLIREQGQAWLEN
jgi:hypothetical protein